MRKDKQASSLPSVLITGASSGIGAAYAGRFARRGHDLVLVARDHKRLARLARQLHSETGSIVDTLPADLTSQQDLAKVEDRVRQDSSIGILINNAGISAPGGFLDQSPDLLAKMIELNTTALMRLASAIAPRLVRNRNGAIVNIGSVVGLAPEFGRTVYGATKAFVLFFSQSLHVELAPHGVYVQAVLPAATRTPIWEHDGIDVNTLPAVMEVDELVDAALVGFDRRETVTIPPLPEIDQWNASNAARYAMVPNFSQKHAALRYRPAADGSSL